MPFLEEKMMPLRTKICLNPSWDFYGPDKNKIEIDIPHTWNAIDGQDGGNDYWRGVCNYTKTFETPEFDKDKEVVYLEFCGVNSSCEVVLNGQNICSHDGGYSTFRADITEHLKDSNELAVSVDNGINDRVYPQKADFTFYGGIYRDVNLIILSKSHFDLDYYGTNGLRITPTVDGNSGIVDIESYTNNKNGEVAITLLDADEVVVAEGSGFNAKLTIPNVHLWDGIADPYLYTAHLTLSVDGVLVDEIKSKFGVRTFKIDSKKGFFLNGRKYPLHGVSRHQDRRGIGNALTPAHHLEDMELIKEIGANTIRLAHYQHDQYFYDLCDEYGMIVWAEIPYISEHMPNGRDNTISQMKELIIQNYNHPSIVTWGLSNEITISTKDKKDMLDNHRVLNDLCHEMDSTRPTSLACYAVCSHFNKSAHISDLVAWNLYLGWYVPGFFLNDWWISFWKFLYPNRPLGYSEYGCEGMPNLHSSKPRRGDHTEEYQAVYHEYLLKCFERFPNLWATHVWNMFDFAADARDQGGEPGMNHKGLITFDRKTKKDSFYLYKAYWSNEPFVHICSKRFCERADNEITVTVYSNQKQVSLFQNGKLISTKTGNRVFKFKVTLADNNKFEAVSGDLRDTSNVSKVAKTPSHYTLSKGKGNSSNWT